MSAWRSISSPDMNAAAMLILPHCPQTVHRTDPPATGAFSRRRQLRITLAAPRCTGVVPSDGRGRPTVVDATGVGPRRILPAANGASSRFEP